MSQRYGPSPIPFVLVCVLCAFANLPSILAHGSAHPSYFNLAAFVICLCIAGRIAYEGWFK